MRVSKGDPVKTASGRRGVVFKVVEDIAFVSWDDGQSFAIREVHLELDERVTQTRERLLAMTQRVSESEKLRILQSLKDMPLALDQVASVAKTRPERARTILRQLRGDGLVDSILREGLVLWRLQNAAWSLI